MPTLQNETNNNSVQDTTDLESLSEQELIDRMVAAVDNMDIYTFDPAELDKYLDALDKISPLNIEYDVEANKAKFFKENAELIRKVFPNEQIPMLPPEQPPLKTRLRMALRSLFKRRSDK